MGECRTGLNGRPLKAEHQSKPLRTRRSAFELAAILFRSLLFLACSRPSLPHRDPDDNDQSAIKLTSNSLIPLIASTPTSTMSNTRPSNIRVKMRLSGLFLLCSPVRKSEASFFPAKNSSDEASSKGWISFFREKEIADGRLSEYYIISSASHTRERFSLQGPSLPAGLSR